jgi:hypothetical protein
MAQAVGRLSLAVEARFHARVSGQSDTGICFSPSSLVSPVNIIPPWLSILIYRLREVNNRPVSVRNSDAVSPHRH